MKKTIALFSILTIFTAFVGCGNEGSTSSNTTETTAIEETTTEIVTTTVEETYIDTKNYKEMVADCTQKINEAAVLLSNVGKWEYNYWSSLIKISGQNAHIDYEDMVSSGISWLTENADVSETVLDDNYKEICNEYNRISALPVNEQEVATIKDSFNELFKDYNNFYTVVTSPSGSISSFSNKYNDYVDSIQSNVNYISAITE